jgi:O-acetyl-ADP-ribose deacetylase (regulator of RNase III)
MKEIEGDLWEYHGTAIIAVTTNGQVSRKGEAVFGRGCARQAGERFPGLERRLGELITADGNHVAVLGEGLVSFPVEHTPYETPDLRLIERSTRELAELADSLGWKGVVLPRPGCGGGGLEWKDVKPILERYLDDRFLVITKPQG